MRDKISDLWLSVLLNLRIRKMDFHVEAVPYDDCDNEKCLTIVAEYKWFWQKKHPLDCCGL